MIPRAIRSALAPYWPSLRRLIVRADGVYFAASRDTVEVIAATNPRVLILRDRDLWRMIER